MTGYREVFRGYCQTPQNRWSRARFGRPISSVITGFWKTQILPAAIQELRLGTSSRANVFCSFPRTDIESVQKSRMCFFYGTHTWNSQVSFTISLDDRALANSLMRAVDSELWHAQFSHLKCFSKMKGLDHCGQSPVLMELYEASRMWCVWGAKRNYLVCLTVRSTTWDISRYCQVRSGIR